MMWIDRNKKSVTRHSSNSTSLGCRLVVALLCTLVPAMTLGATLMPDVKRPNILLIITDQQQEAMMSCAGEKDVQTPAMDRLAATGVRFTRAYASNPVCIPSRVSMMTGLMPSYFGMRSNEQGRNQVPKEALPRGMGWLFRNAGYRTVYGGKTHWLRGMTPETLGFDPLTRDQRQGLAEECAKFMKGSHDKPFLLVASFINPHDICYMAIDDYTRSAGKPTMYPRSHVERQRVAEAAKFPPGVTETDFFAKLAPPLPANYEIPALEPECITTQYVRARGFRAYARANWSDNQWRLHRWAYRRLTEMVDAQIGVVLDALDAAGLDQSTVVVFTSDHGDMNAAHRLEHKSVPYEEAARVPLIVAGHGIQQGGRVDDTHLVAVGLDLIPTICDFASITIPFKLPGCSIRPLAEGRKIDSWRDQVVVESRAARMLRTARYKYVVYANGARREQLTDLVKDPGEMVNLASVPEYHEILNDHRRRLRDYVLQTNDKIAKPFLVESD